MELPVGSKSPSVSLGCFTGQAPVAVRPGQATRMWDAATGSLARQPPVIWGGVCEILGVSEKCGGQCLESLGRGVDTRLCDLRPCSGILDEEEIPEPESGRKEGPGGKGVSGGEGGSPGSRRAAQTLLWKGPRSAHLPGLLRASEEAVPACSLSTAGVANFFSKGPGRKRVTGHTVATGSVATTHLCCCSVDAAGAGVRTGGVAVPRSHWAWKNKPRADATQELADFLRVRLSHRGMGLARGPTDDLNPA